MTESEKLSTRELMRISPVIPVVSIGDPETAVPMARALAAGGIRIIEVTLRTPAALESLRRIVDEVPGMTAGAGTILTPAQADEALAAGAEFLVSPGLSKSLASWIGEHEQVPFLPGVSNLGQVMDARDAGIFEMKFFPAEPAGGAQYLKAVGAPIPDVTFCPTGGIGPGNAASYLGLPNVGCVGGSWLTPKNLVDAQDWEAVAELAAAAAALTRTG